LNLEARMLLSLRRRGQLLLATCVLAGVFVGSGCGMLVESAEAPGTFAVPAWERGSSAMAASTSDRAASGSRAAASPSQAQASDGSTARRAASPDRADRHDKADKQGKHHHGKGKAGKDE
jgi:hypothetical protein